MRAIKTTALSHYDFLVLVWNLSARVLALSTGILIAAIKDSSNLQSRHVVRVKRNPSFVSCGFWCDSDCRLDKSCGRPRLRGVKTWVRFGGLWEVSVPSWKMEKRGRVRCVCMVIPSAWMLSIPIPHSLYPDVCFVVFLIELRLIIKTNEDAYGASTNVNNNLWIINDDKRFSGMDGTGGESQAYYVMEVKHGLPNVQNVVWGVQGPQSGLCTYLRTSG